MRTIFSEEFHLLRISSKIIVVLLLYYLIYIAGISITFYRMYVIGMMNELNEKYALTKTSLIFSITLKHPYIGLWASRKNILSREVSNLYNMKRTRSKESVLFTHVQCWEVSVFQGAQWINIAEALAGFFGESRCTRNGFIRGDSIVGCPGGWRPEKLSKFSEKIDSKLEILNKSDFSQIQSFLQKLCNFCRHF